MSVSEAVRAVVVAILALASVGCATAPGATSAGTAPSAPATGSPIALPADFPIGTWVVTITEQDLRDAGITDPQLLRENTGTFTKTYAADGTFTVVQEAPTPIRWPVFRGTYTPVGADGTEERTTFPSEYVGEVLHYTWKHEGDGIRFTVLDAQDVVLPFTTGAHVWVPK